MQLMCRRLWCCFAGRRVAHGRHDPQTASHPGGQRPGAISPPHPRLGHVRRARCQPGPRRGRAAAVPLLAGGAATLGSIQPDRSGGGARADLSHRRHRLNACVVTVLCATHMISRPYLRSGGHVRIPSPRFGFTLPHHHPIYLGSRAEFFNELFCSKSEIHVLFVEYSETFQDQ